jgi:hypothetical protein
LVPGAVGTRSVWYQERLVPGAFGTRSVDVGRRVGQTVGMFIVLLLAQTSVTFRSCDIWGLDVVQLWP